MSANEIIRVSGLKKYYKGDKIKALDGVDAVINHGEVVVVIGPSGSGKSTFLRSLNLLEVPTEGEIYVDGHNILAKGADINIHRQKMGMVFQHFNLFPNMTVLKNLTLAPMNTKGVKQAEAEAQKKAEEEAKKQQEAQKKADQAKKDAEAKKQKAEQAKKQAAGVTNNGLASTGSDTTAIATLAAIMTIAGAGCVLVRVRSAKHADGWHAVED